MRESESITALVRQSSQGSRHALDELFRITYDELREIAHRQLAVRRPGAAISTTGLVHEAFIKLVGTSASWHDRAHFLAVCAKAMRHILIDYARRVQAAKRGGDPERADLSPTMLTVERLSVNILDLEAALTRLTEYDPRLGRVVELRFYGGLTIEEIAGVLGLSPRTVDRDWYKAKVFLYMMLEGER